MAEFKDTQETLAESPPLLPKPEPDPAREFNEQANAYRLKLDALDRRVASGELTAEGRNRKVADWLAAGDLRYTLAYLQSREDSLTESPNKRAFEEHLQELVQKGESFGLLLLDLDGLKELNSEFGHLGANMILQQYAARILRVIRQAPTEVPGGIQRSKQDEQTDYFSRIGGDEFAILLEGVSTDDELQSIAERVRESISSEDFITTDKQNRLTFTSVTTTIGGGRFQGDLTADALMRQVDRRLMSQKNVEKNKVNING